MFPLPYTSFTIETTATIPRLVEQLSQVVEPSRIRWIWNRGKEHKYFQGQLHERGFRLSRVIHYRNSFLPLIYGRFEEDPLGTTVHVRMHLHPLVLLFLVVWVTVFTFIVLNIAWDANAPLGVLSGVAILLLIMGIVTAVFWYEARKARAKLEAILAPVARAPLFSS